MHSVLGYLSVSSKKLSEPDEIKQSTKLHSNWKKEVFPFHIRFEFMIFPTCDAKPPVPLLENEGLLNSAGVCDRYAPGPGFAF